ncbi:hypothetical protein PAXRUDRAFT_20258 [Paxillus rubicundulus Ve08.2h10]|uniref:Uncharacterized protein n=1 Tax=Paxillus rubicundulus Ve08.2h10 TaxID=930991 RepID=A0A0D0CF43_9AGAM|nr:hypothetical protein PAXRUDRAFT_20258 [Paxillus rubicundulus Ve08.2h10]
MTPSLLTTLLTQSISLTLKKLAKQVAFEAAVAWLHMLALTILGDANNLIEEQDMGSDEWNVAMGAMAKANAGALAKGLTLRLPAAIIPGVQEADNTFGRIVLDAITQKEVANRLEAEAWARAGSPMAEDTVPPKLVHHTPAASESSWATTQSKMEVVFPRVKGKKHLRQDLGSDEVAAFPPQGMVVHQDPCTKCVGSTVPWHGLPGHTCQKCMGLKVNDQTGTFPQPVHTATPVASPSMQPQPSAGSNKEEEAVIMVQAGKGKAISAWVKGVTVDKGNFKEIMW